MKSGESHESTIIRGAGLVLLGTILSTGIGFIIRTFLIRSLPPAEYGLFALALTIGGISTTVGILGLKQGVAQTIPKCMDESEVRDVALTAITSSVTISAGISVVLLFFNEDISTTIIQEPDLAPFLQIVAVLIPAMTIQSVTVAVFRGKKRTRERIVVKNLISPITRLVLVVAAVSIGYLSIGAFMAWTAGVGISTFFGLYYLYTKTSIFDTLSFKPRYRPLLTFSLPLMISSASWTLVQQTDNLLLGFYQTSTEVGFYDSAFFLARLLLIILGAFGFLFMPIFSQLDSENQETRMREVYNSVTEWGVLLTLPIYLALLMNPRSILSLLFGNVYTIGTVPLLIISSGFMIHTLCGQSGLALIALGRSRLVMIGNLLACILNIILNVLLIPEYGIAGAAAASAAAYTIFNIYYLYWLRRELNILPFKAQFVKPLLVSATTIIIIWTILGTISIPSYLSLILIFVLSYLAHLLVVTRTKQITPGDERLLAQFGDKVGIDLHQIINTFR